MACLAEVLHPLLHDAGGQGGRERRGPRPSFVKEVPSQDIRAAWERDRSPQPISVRVERLHIMDDPAASVTAIGDAAFAKSLKGRHAASLPTFATATSAGKVARLDGAPRTAGSTEKAWTTINVRDHQAVPIALHHNTLKRLSVTWTILATPPRKGVT